MSTFSENLEKARTAYLAAFAELEALVPVHALAPVRERASLVQLEMQALRSQVDEVTARVEAECKATREQRLAEALAATFPAPVEGSTT